jgi:hypothetical protein
MSEEEQQQEEMTDEEALMKIAQAMKDNAPSVDEKHNVHTFLRSIVTSKDTTKIGNLRDDKDMNELGLPQYTVRGAKEMALISEKIMDNNYFKEYFEIDFENTLATSLSREGFLVRQGTTQTKQVADVTKRRKINKGWFGKEKIEESGGDK